MIVEADIHLFRAKVFGGNYIYIRLFNSASFSGYFPCAAVTFLDLSVVQLHQSFELLIALRFNFGIDINMHDDRLSISFIYFKHMLGYLFPFSS